MQNNTTYKPSDQENNDPFDAPAPPAPYERAAPIGAATFASVFGTDGATMNGTWSLYGDDDAGSDPGRIDGGWTLIFESDNYLCSVDSGNPRADFDGDGKTDLSVFRPTEGNWYLQRSTDGFAAINWGLSGDVLVPGDYDGDGKADTAIFRASDSVGVADFYILNSNGFTLTGLEWGSTGDVPVVGDYDNDDKADAAIWRPSTGEWFILKSGGGVTITPWGTTGETPIVGDFNGDGSDDLTVRGGTMWKTSFTGGGTQTVDFGMASDLIVPADYDGDGEDDIATFRPSDGVWRILRSSDSVTLFIVWGLSTDIPVPGDYDGDGSDDVAIYRDGTWYMLQSTSGSTIGTFGLSSDLPVPHAYIP